MLRAGLLTLNFVLLVLSAVALGTGLKVLLFPPPVEAVTLPDPPPIERQERAFDRYEALASSSLFRSGAPSSAKAPAPVEEENLADSQLRVRLIGTAVNTARPERSVAIIEDEAARDRLVVRTGEQLQSSGARIVRVERKRIVVENRGKLEQIQFDERKPSGRSRAARPRRAAGPAAARSPGGVSEQVEAVLDAASGARMPRRRAQSILTQARIVPRYANDGRMSGLQVNAIRSGSLLEEAGFENGDVVIAVNGTEVSDPGQGLKIFRDLGHADRFVVEVDRSGTRTRIEYEASP